MNYQSSIQNHHGPPLAEAFLSALLVLGVDLYRAQSVPPISALGAGEAILLWLLSLAFLRWLFAYLNERLLWPLLDRLLPAEECRVLVLEMAPPWPAEPLSPPAGPESADDRAFWGNGEDNLFTTFGTPLAGELAGDDDDFFATSDGGESWTL